MFQSKSAARIIYLAIIMLIACIRIFGDLLSTPYRGDEASYINDSVWFDNWLNRDLNNLEQVNDSKLLDAPVTPLLIGASRYITKFNLEEKYVWMHGLTAKDNVIERSTNPSAQLLLAARLPFAMLAVATTLIIAALILREYGYVISSITVAFLLLNPSFLNWGRIAMTEPALLFFLAQGIALNYFLLTRSNRPRLLLCICTGITFGLAVASKHTGVITLAACLLTFVVAYICKNQITKPCPAKHLTRASLNHIYRSLIIIFSTCTFVFIVLNPFLWNDPVNGIKMVISRRQANTLGQAEMFPKFATNTLQLKMSAFLLWVFTNDSTINCVSTNIEMPVMDVLSQKLVYHEIVRSQWTTHTPLCGTSWPWNRNFTLLTLINFMIFTFSCVAVAYRNIRDLKKNRAIEPSLVILLWTLVICLSTIIFLPMAWDQYFLPPILFTTVLSSIGIGLSMQRITSPLIGRLQLHSLLGSSKKQS